MQQDEIEQIVSEEIANLIGGLADDMPMLSKMGLARLGIYPLLRVELRDALQNRFDNFVSPGLLQPDSTVESLSRDIYYGQRS